MSAPASGLTLRAGGVAISPSPTLYVTGGASLHIPSTDRELDSDDVEDEASALHRRPSAVQRHRSAEDLRTAQPRVLDRRGRFRYAIAASAVAVAILLLAIGLILWGIMRVHNDSTVATGGSLRSVTSGSSVRTIHTEALAGVPAVTAASNDTALAALKYVQLNYESGGTVSAAVQGVSRNVKFGDAVLHTAGLPSVPLIFLPGTSAASDFSASAAAPAYLIASKDARSFLELFLDTGEGAGGAAMHAAVCTSVLAASILNAAVAAAATAAPAPVLTWLSEPTLPGETLLVHGAGFTLNCSLIVTPSPAAPGWNSPAVLPAIAGQSTEGSLKFALPASLPPGALSVAVSCGDGAPSAPWLLNAAVPWWAQGDVGAAATPGGWLRVMGPVLALAPAPEATLLAAIRAARDALTAPGTAADAAWADESPLAATAARLLAARAELADVRARGGGARPVTARLTPRGGGAALYLPAARDTASLHSAAFALPHSLPVGEYDVAVANGCGADTDAGAPAGAGTFVALDFFESMARPHVTGIAVIAPRAWPPGVFLVDTPSDPCAPLPCPSSDAALARALDAARSAGGGTVLFPRGAYFLTQPIAVPPNTVLMGEGGAEAVAVWFAEWNVTSAPKAPLFALDDAAAAASSAPAAQGVGVAGSGLASWGLSSFTLFLTAFHNEVIVVSNHTDGFVMDGMRVRDNPYVFTWGAGPTQGSRGRVANFSISEIGQMVDIHGVNNRITNNDLWGAGHILNSFAPNGGAGNNWPSWRRGHAYSYIADNVLWNGQSSHFMQLWRQVIFERNVITGATTNAGGQSVGTGPMGGVAQHIYHADNVIRFTWGGDREVMTYDDAGGAYYGPLESVNGTTVTLARDAWPASDWEMGGWGGGQIVVINGTGAHQIARIVVPGVNVTPALSNRTWVVDSLFVAAPAVGEGGSWVQVLPFRGRNIFHRDSNIETGPHQFYGHGVESLVTDVHFSSVRGLMAWGQWRGWVPPPPMNNSTWLLHDGDSPLSSRGAMGNGWQPNLHNVYRGVVFTERHHLTNYACGESGYEEQWSWKPIVTYPVSVLNVNITNTPHPVNIGLVYRGTQAPGGFFIGNDTVDVVIEGSNISWSSGECIVRGDLEALVYAANNACAE